MTRAVSAITLTDAQLRIAVEGLIEAGTLREADLLAVLKQRRAEAQKALAAIGELEGSGSSASPLRAMPAQGAATRSARIRPGPVRSQAVPLSPAQARSRKLQGRYLSMIRQIPPAGRAEFQRIVQADPKHGRRDAIALMQKVVGGSGVGRKRGRK